MFMTSEQRTDTGKQSLTQLKFIIIASDGG
jgi:hypothetical protein